MASAEFGVNTTEVLFQSFNWTSSKYNGSSGSWYNHIKKLAPEIAELGVTYVWFPPPQDSLSPEGYMPRDIDKLDSKYGSEQELKACVDELKSRGLHCLADTVLNHRCASQKSPNGQWTKFGGKYDWNDDAIINNDPSFHGRGHPGTGVPLAIAPNIDHQQEFVKRDITEWLNYLRHTIGFEAYRIDYARGFSGRFVGEYMKATEPAFAVAEYWDGLAYDGDYMKPNQNEHRKRIAHYVDATEKRAHAFDFTTKGMLMQACKSGEYWRLKDDKGKPSGFLGMWPQKAVSFIDNHDTGSTQAHWPFPNDKVMQGYAYILTHPGMPTVFYDHVFDWKLKDQIQQLIKLRKEMELTAACQVNIERADNIMYVARVSADDVTSKQLYLKLGHGSWAPSADRGWKLAASGNGYAVWTRSGIPQKEPEPSLQRIASQVAPFLPLPVEPKPERKPSVVRLDTGDELVQEVAALELHDDDMKFYVTNNGAGKKKIVMELEVDEAMAIDCEFTVTLCVQRDDEVETLMKRL
ncbi:Alpha-amylase 3, chloroplastic [Porphyridium purpureum]|uniref:Alpha-amylase 3, chloroplastic n=1 Tax=Porphyridium purpureum TaxID=35688 RepID=A0A5J4YVU2_PORPP|nr:Alpha-amylase 3, chloroplastic [Porphyridium purpureum]|eukprot:POR4239..scf209_3